MDHPTRVDSADQNGIAEAIHDDTRSNNSLTNHDGPAEAKETDTTHNNSLNDRRGSDNDSLPTHEDASGLRGASRGEEASDGEDESKDGLHGITSGGWLLGLRPQLEQSHSRG